MTDVKRFREMDIERLVIMAGDLDDAEKQARKAMNSFYRLAAYNEWLVTMENDAEAYNYYVSRDLEDGLYARFEAWHKRLNEYFKPFGAIVKFYGIYPTLETMDGRNITYGHYYR